MGNRSTDEEAKELGGPGLVHAAAHIAEPGIHAGGIHRLGGRPGNGAVIEVLPFIVFHVVGAAGGIIIRIAPPVAKVVIAIAAVAMAVPVIATIPPRLPSVKGSVVARAIERRRRRRASTLMHRECMGREYARGQRAIDTDTF